MADFGGAGWRDDRALLSEEADPRNSIRFEHVVDEEIQGLAEQQQLEEEELDIGGLIVEDEVAVQADEEDVCDQRGELGDGGGPRVEDGRDEDQGNDVSHVFREALQEGNGDGVD